MPYIKQEDRDRLEVGHVAETPGELNYVLTEKAIQYLEHKAQRQGEKLGYADLNEVMGVFTCASAEFYRRVVAEYENDKCRINGDVY